MNLFYKKGITALELLFVVAVIGIIVAIAAPQFLKMKQNQVLKNTTEDIFSVINKARSQTLASLNSSEYGVHFQSDKIIIFKGKNFVANDANNEITTIVSPATISSINLAGGASSFYFNRLSGMPSISGTVTVSVSAVSKVITVSPTGTVSFN